MGKDCIKEQDTLIPLEQAARQKVSELVSVMESERSQGSVLKEILRAKETNHIKGIYGRMGDLGAIDAKYDVAISTACPGLDYILVETADAAQKCVDLLREKSLGIATFMILEKQQRHNDQLKRKVQTPEGVPRLFDLIRVKDEKLKPAFYELMRNTVVAKDLDQASRIACARNREFGRVVTIDGALFEKSGTMSGGGSKPRGGRMGTLIRADTVSREAVADAEKELGIMVDKVNEFRRRISDSSQRYQSLYKTVQHLEMELAKSQKEVKTQSSDKTVQHLEMELAKSQKEIDSMKTQHDYLKNQLDSLKSSAQTKKEEVTRLEELRKAIAAEEKEITRLVQGSKLLKEKRGESESLSDIDDAEINSYLNSEKEKQYKKIIWEKMNQEYLQEQEAKKTAANATKPKKENRQKPKTGVKKSQSTVETTDLASSKRCSSRINYDALSKILGEPVLSDNSKKRKTESLSDQNARKSPTDDGHGEDDEENGWEEEEPQDYPYHNNQEEDYNYYEDDEF